MHYIFDSQSVNQDRIQPHLSVFAISKATFSSQFSILIFFDS